MRPDSDLYIRTRCDYYLLDQLSGQLFRAQFYFIKIISSRFYGDYDNFITEPSSNFEHQNNALGSYRKSPFVTGSYRSSRDGLKTEILDLTAGQWNQVADYPFTNGEG